MKKCLIIGLDGVTWNPIRPWVDEGDLPTFKKLMEDGVWANLESTMPPTTGAAWVSYATGRNPGKHGVFDFVKFKKKTYDLEVVSSTDIKSKTYYEDLSEKGCRSILINLPVSYPPKKINGIIVTSFLTQDTSKMVYPSEIRSRYPDAFKSYKLYPSETQMINPSQYIHEVSRIETTRFAIAKSLFLNEKWDHFFLLFSGTDWISHLAMGHLSAKHSKVKDAFIKQFKEIDSYVKWFLENQSGEVNLFLVSDHGQTQRRKLLYINEWLCQKGYGISKLGKAERPRDLLEREKSGSMPNTGEIILPKKIVGIVRKTPIAPIVRHVIKILQDQFRVRLATRSYAIDKARSKAFCTTGSSHGIYINDRARFENGIVRGEEFEKVREYLIRELTDLKDSPAGERLLERTWRKEEVYHGPFVDKAPDIVLLPANGVSFPPSVTRASYIEEDVSRGGCHNMSGIFLAYGPDIKQGLIIGNVKIYDIAPTILYVFGLPIPRDMDGRVLKEIFEEGSELARREITYQEAEAADEKGRIKERIKELKAFGKI